ncbi:TraR/DksA family transcriptional regulator [Peredibacter starrii]|uniref:TraR/DksA family transcriptional regulator n=1 Tax=Peredibacter starrii TaxID=28202 RepID=A0AAX4HQB5_9BACT|nr:TraR/DksA family transcriptional regulator [Peredibacter starrii]WPU65467.1 TraR/DksA family transcriptional regulator [Peredibacter starrii]
MAEKIKALTKKQLETLKNKLLEEKQSLVFNDKNGAAELDLALTNGGDDVEQSISDYNNSHQLRFRNREVFYAKKIDKALKKFDTDEYGLCSDCGCWIKFERLMARPTAEMCIVCKEESERDESNSFIGRQSKSLGKVVDLTGMMA